MTICQLAHTLLETLVYWVCVQKLFFRDLQEDGNEPANLRAMSIGLRDWRCGTSHFVEFRFWRVHKMKTLAHKAAVRWSTFNRAHAHAESSGAQEQGSVGTRHKATIHHPPKNPQIAPTIRFAWESQSEHVEACRFRRTRDQEGRWRMDPKQHLRMPLDK